MDDFTRLTDLAAERFGGAVVAANDEFFAEKENLVKAAAPVWKDGLYTDRGKWMDGWETRRRREPGHDWAIVRLGIPGSIEGVVVDTAFFTGNYPEHCSIEACEAPPNADLAALEAAHWTEILPKSALKGDSRNVFPTHHALRTTHLRLRIYPDGGVARLRVHGIPSPDWASVAGMGWVDLASLELGGRVVAQSDMFYGDANNMLQPGRSTHMGDGWETKRRRGPGHDWAIVRLARAGEIRRIEIDTDHFKGNAPGACTLDVARTAGDPLKAIWTPILGETKLQPHARHVLETGLVRCPDITHARLNIYPDGGIARLRLFGTVTVPGR